MSYRDPEEKARREAYWRRLVAFERDIRPDRPVGIAAGMAALRRRARLRWLALSLAAAGLMIAVAALLL